MTNRSSRTKLSFSCKGETDFDSVRNQISYCDPPTHYSHLSICIKLCETKSSSLNSDRWNISKTIQWIGIKLCTEINLYTYMFTFGVLS